MDSPCSFLVNNLKKERGTGTMDENSMKRFMVRIMLLATFSLALVHAKDRSILSLYFSQLDVSK
jgi:hypothetical protein